MSKHPQYMRPAHHLCSSCCPNFSLLRAARSHTRVGAANSWGYRYPHEHAGRRRLVRHKGSKQQRLTAYLLLHS